MTHEVAYGSLLRERRTTLHATVVTAIERLYADRLAEHVERLAHHALRADDWQRAVTYARTAGDKARERWTLRESATWFEQALGGVSNLPESRESRELTVDLCLDLRNVLSPLGADREIVEHLRLAETIASTLGDQQRLGRVYSVMSTCLRQLGEYDDAIDAGQKALRIAATTDDAALHAITTNYMATLYMERCDYRLAVESLRPIFGSLRGPTVDEIPGLSIGQVVTACTNMGRSLSFLGELDVGLTYAERGIRIAEAHDDRFILATAYNIAGGIHLRRGEAEPAHPPR